MVVSSCFIFSFSGLARASMMQSEDRVKKNGTENKTDGCLHLHTQTVASWLNEEATAEDTGQNIVVEGREVFQGVHHWNNEVAVPLDLRQHLIDREAEQQIRQSSRSVRDIWHRHLLRYKILWYVKMFENEIHSVTVLTVWVFFFVFLPRSFFSDLSIHDL